MAGTQIRWMQCCIMGMAWFFQPMLTGTPPALATVWLMQQQVPAQAVRAQLFAIEGHGQMSIYVLRDTMGRFHRLRIDAQTKRERPLVPGEWVDVQVAPDGRAVSVMPAK